VAVQASGGFDKLNHRDFDKLNRRDLGGSGG
jgi:hypothetical protein